MEFTKWKKNEYLNYKLWNVMLIIWLLLFGWKAMAWFCVIKWFSNDDEQNTPSIWTQSHETIIHNSFVQWNWKNHAHLHRMREKFCKQKWTNETETETETKRKTTTLFCMQMFIVFGLHFFCSSLDGRPSL